MAGTIELPASPTGLTGLTGEEAARRLIIDGPNELPRIREPSIATRMLHHSVEPLSLVLAVAALVSITALGHTVEGLAIAAIVVLNVVIGTAQEERAANAIAALNELVAPTARARRDGGLSIVPAAALVRGDVVELTAGDRVPADLVLAEAIALAIDEAILTGESFPAAKTVASQIDPDPGDGRAHNAFAGTSVVRGHGIGVVTATGRSTEMGAIASGLDRPAEPSLVRDLRGVAARMSVLAVALGVALVPLVLLRAESEPDPLLTAILAGVALAVAAIPEGLATVVVMALALGARRMATRGAVVRRLAAIEALGAAEVICADKTGTITTGRLTVSAVLPVTGRALDLWHAALRCNDAHDGVGDPIDVALIEAATKRGIVIDAPVRVGERPFETETRSMATLDEVNNTLVLSLKGAPEVVLRRCTAGAIVDELADAATAMAEQGMRVLAFA